MRRPVILDDEERQEYVDNGDESLYRAQQRAIIDDDDDDGKEQWIREHRREIDDSYDAMLNPCAACNAMPDQRGCPAHS